MNEVNNARDHQEWIDKTEPTVVLKRLFESTQEEEGKRMKRNKENLNVTYRTSSGELTFIR
jgi:hypothetical protein